MLFILHVLNAMWPVCFLKFCYCWSLLDFSFSKSKVIPSVWKPDWRLFIEPEVHVAVTQEKDTKILEMDYLQSQSESRWDSSCQHRSFWSLWRGKAILDTPECLVYLVQLDQNNRLQTKTSKSWVINCFFSLKSSGKTNSFLTYFLLPR